MAVGTPARSRRIEARIDPESDDVIAHAAALTHESKSAFMVRTAREAAERVLARADVTLMPAEQFDQMMASLDDAEPLPVLARAAAAPRVVRRG
ncbi:MAG: DUF1778 domain-containing protein [Micrococcales bacterium]|nr:DUF1778 domain-containing protein [Micrococcales bacterium]